MYLFLLCSDMAGGAHPDGEGGSRSRMCSNQPRPAGRKLQAPHHVRAHAAGQRDARARLDQGLDAGERVLDRFGHDGVDPHRLLRGATSTRQAFGLGFFMGVAACAQSRVRAISNGLPRVWILGRKRNEFLGRRGLRRPSNVTVR